MILNKVARGLCCEQCTF